MKITTALKDFGQKTLCTTENSRKSMFPLIQQFQLVCIFKPGHNVENSDRGKCRHVSARVAALFLPVFFKKKDQGDLIKDNIAKNLATSHFNNYT